jgi:glycosyltransferase involved in cell wall biosynthesis
MHFGTSNMIVPSAEFISGTDPLRTRSADAKVSIVIPTHNSVEVLPRAIDSALAQSHRNIEVIVVDDASDKDITGFISKKYAGEDRIKLHRHSTNKMAGGARNSGIDLATGDFVFFLDADDKLLPDAIALLVAVAIANDVDVVQGASLIEDEAGEFKPYHSACFASGGGVGGLEFFAAHQFASIVWNKLYRRSLLTSSNIRFAEQYLHQDVPFSARVAFHAKGIVSITDPIVHYTTNSNSLTHRNPGHLNLESYIATYLALIGVVEDFGLVGEEYRYLLLRILASHGSADFGPKLLRCFSGMGASSFAGEVVAIAYQHFGFKGVAAGDLINFFIKQIEQRDIEIELRKKEIEQRDKEIQRLEDSFLQVTIGKPAKAWRRWGRSFT